MSTPASVSAAGPRRGPFPPHRQRLDEAPRGAFRPRGRAVGPARRAGRSSFPYPPAPAVANIHRSPPAAGAVPAIAPRSRRRREGGVCVGRVGRGQARLSPAETGPAGSRCAAGRPPAA